MNEYFNQIQNFLIKINNIFNGTEFYFIVTIDRNQILLIKEENLIREIESHCVIESNTIEDFCLKLKEYDKHFVEFN